MKSFFNQYQNKSVINTDSFDRRRFNKIYNMSKRLQELNDFEKPFPTFEPLLSDIWSSLYKMSPKLKDDDEVQDELKTNHSFIKNMLNDSDFNKYHDTTKLDELSSAIGTVKFGEKTKEWLEEQRQESKELDQQLQNIQSMQRQLEKQEKDGAGQGNELLQNDLEQAMQTLHESVSQMLKNNSHSFSQKLSQAMKDTKETKDDVKSLIGGTAAGSGDAELKNTPLRDQLSLAEKLSRNERLKSIAEWAGRFKQIARQKQKTTHKDSIEHSGVTIGNEIEKLLPSELALYSHETTKLDFLRRFSEHQTMQYDTKAKETLGKGPIILCLDQSGSMRKLDEQSKGFVLALMSIAKKQKRDFCYIPFSIEVMTYRYPKGKITLSEMIQLSGKFLGGGTDFRKPLNEAIKVINESRFKQSDIVFVTDGEASLNNVFITDFNKAKEERGFSVLSLVIGNAGITRTPKRFSNKVVTINNLNDEGSYTAFEI